MDFNLQVSDEEEAEESIYDEEVDPKVLSDTPTVPLPGEAEIPAEAGSSPSLVGALPSYTHGLEARTTEAARGSTPNI